MNAEETWRQKHYADLRRLLAENERLQKEQRQMAKDILWLRDELKRLTEQKVIEE